MQRKKKEVELPHTVFKNLFKMHNRPNNKRQNFTFLKGNTGINLHDLGWSNSFLDMTPKAQVIKEKNRNLNTSKLMGYKWYHQESEKTTHRMGENICKWYNW